MPLKNNPRPDHAALASMGKELGCGLITVVVFTAPLWAFSVATRGPRFALVAGAGLLLVMVLVVVLSRALRRR